MFLKLDKMKSRKGFTLMEMLIVIAIIAVLVAIAIPVMNAQLTKSKEAADIANIRSAYAGYQIAALNEEEVKATDIADIASFVKKYADDATLNYPDNVKDGTESGYTKPAKDTAGKIVYKPTKANGGKAYTWNLAALTNDATTTE